ncbi:MAG: hypothetical protein ACK4YQ_12630 [Phenylobacterium sp.]|uniref:hypothetical protein n=1 Tax=Phenylobacterium sp. TaxID=1871053 RepID=UPI00391CD303
MKARSTLLGLLLGLGFLLFGAGLPATALAQCCTPPTPPQCCTTPTPPPCCTTPTPPTCCHSVNVPGVNVNVASTVVVNANASALASTRAGAGAAAGVVVFGGGGGGGYYSPPTPTGLVQLNVEGGKRMKKVAYQASRSRTRRVVIQAVCIDDRQVPHPASQVRPDRDVADGYDGELYRCIAGTWLQATIADFDGKIDFSGGQTLACAKGDALYHAPGGKVECRRQKPARDCNERSLLRRFGAGVKILTITTTETYTAYREEEEASETYASSMSLDGGVGGIAY